MRSLKSLLIAHPLFYYPAFQLYFRDFEENMYTTNVNIVIKIGKKKLETDVVVHLVQSVIVSIISTYKDVLL